MNEQIAFPNLGLVLEHVPREFHIGPLTIALYGICVALSILAGIRVVLWRAAESGQDPDAYVDLCIWTVVCAIIGARIYYVIFSFEDYRGDLLSVFRIHEGGLAIYGGIIAGALALIVMARMRKLHPALLLDTCVVGLPLGQILGRWGNFFNREAFGGYTNSLLAMRLPVSAVRAGEISSEMMRHAEMIGGETYIRVHPTFLYESLLSCLVFAVLLIMRKRTAFRGELFLIYLTGYGLARMLVEPLRTDQLKLFGTGLPVSFVLSAVLSAGSAALIIILRRRAARRTPCDPGRPE